MVQIHTEKSRSRAILLPNRSASWQQVKWMLIALGALTFAIALFWAVQGAWVILPFAGLEVGALSYFVYRVNWHNHHQQVLVKDNDELQVEYGYRSPHQRWRFDTRHCEVVVTHPHHSLSAPAIHISEGDESLPVGQFLNKEDAQQFIDWVVQAGLRHRYRGQIRTTALNPFGE